MPKVHRPRKHMEAGTACAMVLRVYPTRGQEKRSGHWLWVAQKFRNEAVAFLSDRRRRRGAWIRDHRALARGWIPEEFRGSDTTACSAWLTARLSDARNTVVRELGLTGDKRTLVTRVTQAFAQLSRGEQNEVADGWLLTVPRTVLDQVVRDLEKTVNKAIADRKEAKARKTNKGTAAGKPGGKKKRKTKRLVGFPRHRKHRYPASVRVQIEANKNTQFRDHWAAGQLFIPGLGKLRFRDGGYKDLPATPPKLITLARNAAGQWQVSFLCVAQEYRNARRRKQEAAGLPTELGSRPLPLDPRTGMPTVEGLDASVPDRAVSNRATEDNPKGHTLGKTKYLKRCLRRLRHANKSVARKQKGSRRWLKAKRAQGRIHVRVANLRKAEVITQAQAVAARSAIVCVEDLVIAFMLQNRCLAASAHEAALGKFKTALARECAKLGHLLLETPRFAATTQTCPITGCGFVNRELKNNLKCRAWTCPGCGAHHDRDIAAAHNIQAMALQAAIDRLQEHQATHGALDTSRGPENGLRMLSSHRLHPDLAAFIARGGLTALLEAHASSESHTREIPGGLAGAREARVLPKQPMAARREREVVG